MPNSLNTIASIGSINTPIPQTQTGNTAPTTRSGGQPLQNGDRWFNTDTSSESFYYDGQWVDISQSGPPGADGAPGAPGAPGPSAVSSDVNNSAILGSDNLIFVPTTTGSVTSVNDKTGIVSLGIRDMNDYDASNVVYTYEEGDYTQSGQYGTLADTFIFINFTDYDGNSVPIPTANSSLWVSNDNITFVEQPVTSVSDNGTAWTINTDDRTPFNNLGGGQLFLSLSNISLEDGDVLQWNDTDQKFKPVQLSAGGGGVTISDVNTIIDNRRQSTTRVDISETALWVGEAAPVVDPGGKPGWYFANNGNKIQWAVWTNDLEAEKQFTYSEMKSASLVIRNSGTMYPYFSVYTRRKNDGNDYNVSYRSRYNFEINQDDSGSATKTRLLTTLDNNPINGNIPHRVATLQGFSSVGPREPDEVVKNITLGSGSGTPVGAYDFVASELIIDTVGEMFSIELNATPVIDSNTSRMYYQATAPGVLGRKDGDFWYDTTNTTLNIWTGSSWTAL